MNTLKTGAAVLLGLALLAPGASAQQKAHEHGHWKMNAAVEGNRLLVELIAPGADVAGFEHEAKTAKEKAKVWEAKEKLKAAATLIKLPPAAGCTLESAEAEIANMEHGGEKHGHDKHSHGKHGHEDAHNEYHAEYAFVCQNIASLSSITVGVFEQFPEAQEVEAAVLTAKGQRAAELKPGNASIDLGGLL